MKEDLNSLIKTWAKSGIISHEIAAAVKQDMIQQRRAQILKKHPYAIWQNKRGYYVTNIKDPTKPKGKRQIARKTRKALEDYLIENIREEDGDLTFEEVYYRFREKLIDYGNVSKATVNRYDSDFKRFYTNQEWNTKRISDISMEGMVDFLEESVGNLKLTSRAFSSMKTLTKNILKRARRDRLIDYSYADVFSELEVHPRKVHKSPVSQVFTDRELPVLIQYLLDHQDVHNLCLLLMILTGLRVGEMSTLKYSDFLSDTCFEVKRTQTKWRDENGKYHYDVKDSPKTEAGFRKAFIPADYAWIITTLRKLRPFTEYLATNSSGERMTAETLRKRLYRICDSCDLQKKSTHKIRKTFCSIILDAGFDKNLVISLMGHTDINTSENYYHFDRKSSAEKQRRVDNLLDFKLNRAL